jgi:hypothetical protein
MSQDPRTTQCRWHTETVADFSPSCNGSYHILHTHSTGIVSEVRTISSHFSRKSRSILFAGALEMIIHFSFYICSLSLSLSLTHTHEGRIPVIQIRQKPKKHQRNVRNGTGPKGPTRKCVRERSGEAAFENGTQNQKHLFFAAKPLGGHPRSGWDAFHYRHLHMKEA